MKAKTHRKNINNYGINQRSYHNSSDDYDKKYMKIKLNSDNDLLLKKTLKLYNMIIVIRSAFHKGNKYTPQVFFDECLSKL